MRLVDKLPDLSGEGFGELPTQLSEGHILLAFNTRWNKSEPETVASAVVTACIRAGRWEPVEDSVLLELLLQYPVYQTYPGECRDAMWKLIDDGEAELVEFQGKHYMIPAKSLIEAVLEAPTKRQMVGSKLTLQPAQ